MDTPPLIRIVLDDLAAEFADLDRLLAPLDAEAWALPSAAPGWTVADVVSHLAVTEELVSAALGQPTAEWNDREAAMDDAAAAAVAAAGLDGPEAHRRWRAACTASLTGLAGADPGQRVGWAAAPLKPRTLAVTRLAEHWAHRLDVAEPLGAEVADTDRLRHVAWLGHATLPYAFGLAGLDPAPVRCELTGPSGDRWALGPADAPTVIRGRAGVFCRVGARRIPGRDSGLEATGPAADAVLDLLRNYAA